MGIWYVISSFLSGDLVCHFLQVEADSVTHPAKFHYNVFFVHASEAESGLERLYQCAEKELQVFLNVEGPSNDFNEFSTKFARLTR